MENIRHHVEDEEEDLFPKLRRLVDTADLAVLGEAMALLLRLLDLVTIC